MSFCRLRTCSISELKSERTDCRARLPRSKPNRGALCYRSFIKRFLSAVHVCVCTCVSGKICFKPQRVFLRLSQTAGGGEPRTWQMAQLLSRWIFERSQAYDKKTEAGDGERKKKNKRKNNKSFKKSHFHYFCRTRLLLQRLGTICGRQLSERQNSRSLPVSKRSPFIGTKLRLSPPRNTVSRFLYSLDISEKELTESSASDSAAAKGSPSSGAPFSWQQKKKQHTPKKKQMSADL